jgi:hypothetical protein
MSRATIRAAVVAFFQPPAVSGLNTVYSAFPKRITGPDFRNGQSAGTASGCVGVIDITSSREERIAIGGATSGKKWVHYTVDLHLFCHSIELHSETAMAFFDGVVDAVKTKLRSDRWLNDYPAVFEAGERELIGRYGEPKVLNDGATEIWGSITFEVSEVITT